MYRELKPGDKVIYRDNPESKDYKSSWDVSRYWDFPLDYVFTVAEMRAAPGYVYLVDPWKRNPKGCSSFAIDLLEYYDPFIEAVKQANGL